MKSQVRKDANRYVFSLYLKLYKMHCNFMLIFFIGNLPLLPTMKNQGLHLQVHPASPDQIRKLATTTSSGGLILAPSGPVTGLRLKAVSQSHSY
jgi:hypothetical protein